MNKEDGKNTLMYISITLQFINSTKTLFTFSLQNTQLEDKINRVKPGEY